MTGLFRGRRKINPEKDLQKRGIDSLRVVFSEVDTRDVAYPLCTST